MTQEIERRHRKLRRDMGHWIETPQFEYTYCKLIEALETKKHKKSSCYIGNWIVTWKICKSTIWLMLHLPWPESQRFHTQWCLYFHNRNGNIKRVSVQLCRAPVWIANGGLRNFAFQTANFIQLNIKHLVGLIMKLCFLH